MDINTIIIDNFLPQPDLVRASALNAEYEEGLDYPGYRSGTADNDYQMYIHTRFQDILQCKIAEFNGASFCFQLCDSDTQTWVHKDHSDWAGVLYLTPDAPLDSGTGIFEEKNGELELCTAIGNKYNRLVLYRGDMLHSSIVAGFGDSKENARLTQVFFFDIEGNVGGGW